jgi:hypothetical protein
MPSRTQNNKLTATQSRHRLGRQARLRAEVAFVLDGTPIQYSCIYRRKEQAKQFKRGWNSVTEIDIDVAIKQARTEEIHHES